MRISKFISKFIVSLGIVFVFFWLSIMTSNVKAVIGQDRPPTSLDITSILLGAIPGTIIGIVVGRFLKIKHHRGHVTVLKSSEKPSSEPTNETEKGKHRGHVTVLKNSEDVPSNSENFPIRSTNEIQNGKHRGHVTVLK